MKSRTYITAPTGLNFMIAGDRVLDMFAGKLHAKVILADANDLFVATKKHYC